tara:strand:+ start:3607 stop:3867 length:261 start_codon:yes stop_codon:yes gene_type:complete
MENLIKEYLSEFDKTFNFLENGDLNCDIKEVFDFYHINMLLICTTNGLVKMDEIKVDTTNEPNTRKLLYQVFAICYITKLKLAATF